MTDETTPNGAQALMHASAGRPGPLTELIEDEVSGGLVVTPGNVPAMAAALERLIKDRDLGENLARNARENIVREWDNTVLMPKFVEMISSV